MLCEMSFLINIKSVLAPRPFLQSHRDSPQATKISVDGNFAQTQPPIGAREIKSKNRERFAQSYETMKFYAKKNT
jgi:hypothetical protein